MTDSRPIINPHDVLCVILGGGAGTRLYPLTKERSKPAVPLGGKYRLVDVPISNCINAGFKRIYVLTQFNSASLHRHISQSFKFDHFEGGFVEILAAEQTPTDTSWYQGTADAVRKNLVHLLTHPFQHLLILSGDQLYRMDGIEIIAHHIRCKADITVATTPVGREAVSGLGIMQMSTDHRVVRFEEKPKEEDLQQSLKLDPEWFRRLSIQADTDRWLASMGIYVFTREALTDLLDNPFTDFGKHIIPDAIQSHRVYSYIFQGYWEDIGTIRAFFEANLEFAQPSPRFSFFEMQAPIFTHPRFLPASMIQSGKVTRSLISDGCIVRQATLSDTLLGIRSIVRQGASLNRTVVIGADYYETREEMERRGQQDIPPIGIGANTSIENAIIDKNARIGKNCKISPQGKPAELDHPLYYIRDAIVIIPKNATIPDNTLI